MQPSKKTVATLIALTLSGSVLAGCSSSTSTTDNGGNAEGQVGSGNNQKIVIYSNSVSDGRGDWLTEYASEAGFDIQYVDLGGGEVYNRLLGEAANPVADVTFGLNSVYFEKLKAADVLEQVEPMWAEQVTDASMDPDGYFWPIVTEPIMLVYNVAAYPTPSEAPSDWPDLWEDAKFHGLYETQTSLTGATVQMVISGILTRYTDPEGNLGVSDDGWDAIDQFFEYGNPAVTGTDLFARMAAGEVNMGQMWLAGKVEREAQYGIVTEAVHPEIGVPMVSQGVALIKGAKHKDAAIEFIDWFGSAEVQAAWSNQFGTAPANVEAQPMGNQEIIDYTNSFTAQDIDWTFVAENIDAWIEEIELNYMR